MSQLTERASAGEVSEREVAFAVVAAEDEASASSAGNELRRAFDNLTVEERAKLRRYAEFVFLFFTPYGRGELAAVPSSRRYAEAGAVVTLQRWAVLRLLGRARHVLSSEDEYGETEWVQWRWVLRLWMTFTPWVQRDRERLIKWVDGGRRKAKPLRLWQLR